MRWRASITGVNRGQTGAIPRSLVIAAGVLSLVAVLSVGLAFYLRSLPTQSATVRVATEAPAPAATLAPTAPPAEAPSAAAPAPIARAPRAPAPKKAAEPEAAEAAAPTLASLTVESDVPGASVFIDRQYVGNTPLSLQKVEPGTRTINLSADGYNGIQKSVDLAAGPNAVSMRFKEVRLNARVGVVHKHGMGSCDGTLVATVDGLTYETDNKGDTFTLPFAQVEAFAVDYLQKNLHVKQKGGRTWNFTDKNPTPDALFVFHRDVEAARKKLANGYAAVK